MANGLAVFLLRKPGARLVTKTAGHVVVYETGCLHMRYTTRARSIAWKDDVNLHKAVGFIRELLAGDSPWIVRHRLQAGEGIICNNVLHAREAFTDNRDAARLLYRARYHDRIKGTEMTAGTGEVDKCSG